MGKAVSKTVTMQAPSAKKAPHIHDLVSLLARVEQLTRQQHQVCLADIVGIVGTRWFGPLLMVPGLVMVVPGIGDIPGVSAMMGLVVLLLSIQAIFDRSTVWLPHWLATRPVGEAKIKRMLQTLRRPAAFVDRHTERRLTWAVRHASIHVIAATCIVIAAMTPVLELIPLSCMLAGAAISTFGLALLASDGLIALVAIAFSVGTIGMLANKFIF
ncbi:MAG: exopolysaccharide biosynthesis protein [Pseudomonadota bacterium]